MKKTKIHRNIAKLKSIDLFYLKSREDSFLYREEMNRRFFCLKANICAIMKLSCTKGGFVA